MCNVSQFPILHFQLVIVISNREALLTLACVVVEAAGCMNVARVGQEMWDGAKCVRPQQPGELQQPVSSPAPTMTHLLLPAAIIVTLGRSQAITHSPEHFRKRVETRICFAVDVQ